MMEDTPFLFYNLCKERIKLQCKWGKWRPMQGSSGRTEVWGVLLKNLSFFFFLHTHIPTSQLPSLSPITYGLQFAPQNSFQYFLRVYFTFLWSSPCSFLCQQMQGLRKTQQNSPGELLTVQRSINSSPEVISYISRRCSLMTKKSSCYWGIVQNVYSFV